MIYVHSIVQPYSILAVIGDQKFIAQSAAITGYVLPFDKL